MVTRPDQLADLPAKGQALIEAWIALSAKLLVQPLVSISCLVNPQAIYVGGRLPTDLLADRLVEAVNARLAAIEDVPALARSSGLSPRPTLTGRGRGPAAVHDPAAAVAGGPDEDRPELIFSLLNIGLIQNFRSSRRKSGPASRASGRG